MKTAVLFICLGNICRSPTAHGIFAQQVEQAGLGNRIAVDSCGTGGWHAGEGPDKRAVAAAKQRGYDLSALRARQLSRRDFKDFDYLMVMDQQNLADVQAQCPANFSGRLDLFLRYAAQVDTATQNGGNNRSDAEANALEVPDPYYGGPQGFDQVIDLIEAASLRLLEHVSNDLASS